jgi:hypothetical protein
MRVSGSQGENKSPDSNRTARAREKLLKQTEKERSKFTPQALRDAGHAIIAQLQRRHTQDSPKGKSEDLNQRKLTVVRFDTNQHSASPSQAIDDLRKELL